MRECTVDGAHGSDLYQPFTLGFVKVPLQMDLALDFVEHPRFGLTILAVSGVNTTVAKPNLDALQRDSFPLRIHAECD